MSSVRPYLGVRPSFLVALDQAGGSRGFLRLIASQDVNTLDVFEAVARNEITPEEGAWILVLQREAEPWPVRFLRWVFA